MRTVWQFHTSGQLVFGWGAVRQLPALMLRRKFRRVFLVTDRVLAENGILEQVRTPLVDAGLDVDVFAAKAFAIKRLMMVNPRQPTEADLMGILREAF